MQSAGVKDIKVPGENVGRLQYFSYGVGNFASQLSWTMVSTYLSLFYTDVFGLEAGAVAILFLIAKVWDAVNDPMMGEIMEHTHTRFGRFRPYMVVGAPLLVLFTVLTFTVPGFGSVGKLVYAYVTYIGLGMAYTMTNIPYLGLPAVMTTDSKKINRLEAAQMIGMVWGMIILNLGTLPLVKYLGHGDQKMGYQLTASLFAIVALPLFWFCAKTCKEAVVIKKEGQATSRESLKQCLRNKNLRCVIIYNSLNIFGIMGRIGVAVYFYLYVVKSYAYITIFMMMQMIVGAVLMPFAPKVIEKFGKKNVIYFASVIQTVGLLMMIFGPYTNIPYLFLCHVVYGTGYIAGPCGSCLLVDALDDMDLKTGIRPDGTAFALSSLGTKMGTALGSALGMAVLGWFGYSAKEAAQSIHIQTGITVATNVLPAVVFLLCIIPIVLFSLKESDMPAIRAQLKERNEKQRTTADKSKN
jgi:sugar (glycoside-pentoside-hexuronide) transporter